MVEYFNHLRREKAFLVLALLAALAITTYQLGRKPHFFYRSGQNQVKARPVLITLPAFFQNWRHQFLERNERYDQSGLYRGIFLGDDSHVSQDDRRLFRKTGLSHILAASGFNCWIVAMAFGLMAQTLLVLINDSLPARFALSVRSLILPLSRILGAWLFWSWSDQSPPITRSATMVSVKFALDALGFKSTFERLLIVHYLISLVLIPRWWLSASFQLTYGCLLGVVLFPKLIKRWRPETATWVWDYLAAGTGACLGALPTTWIWFGEANFNSLLTNAFVVPVVSLAIMPLGVVQMLVLLAPQNPITDSVFEKCGWLAGGISHGLRVFLEAWIEYIPSLSF